MGLESFNKLENTSAKIDNDTALRNEINEAITDAVNKGNFTAEEDKHAVNVISSLRPKQLAAYITLTFKNGDTWQNYQEMCGNRYHAFMVQAVLDFLSDKYGDKKYNIKGEIGPDDDTTGTYKSLDERLGEGGVDNTKGSKTTNAIKVLQSIWGIPCDGYAGPQFFVKACAELNGLGTPGNYNVNGRANYTKKYGFNSNDQTVVIETADSGRQSINFKCPSGVNVEYDSSALVYKIIRNGAETGFTISGQSGQFTIKQPDDYSSEMGNYTINTNNEITYKGPSEVLNEKEITFLGTKFKFQDGYTFGKIEDTTDTTLYNQGKKLEVRYNGGFCCYIGANSNNEFSPHGNTERDGYNNLNLVKNADGSYTIGSKNNPDGNPRDPDVHETTEEESVHELLNKLPQPQDGFRFALKDNEGNFTYYYIQNYSTGFSLHKCPLDADSGGFVSSDQFTRITGNSSSENSFYKNVIDLINVSSGAYEIKNAKCSDMKNALSGIDLSRADSLSNDHLAKIGEDIPRIKNDWSFASRVELGKRCLSENSQHTGGRDFISWCERMGNLGLNRDELKIRHRYIFEGFLNKKMDNVTKIYYA